jgi:hypothetical protein
MAATPAVVALPAWLLIISRGLAAHGRLSTDMMLISNWCRRSWIAVSYDRSCWRCAIVVMDWRGCGHGCGRGCCKSASCWQPVVDGDGPNHDVLSTRALAKMTAEVRYRFWLFACPPCMLCRWCVGGSGKSWLARRAWCQARKSLVMQAMTFSQLTTPKHDLTMQ